MRRLTLGLALLFAMTATEAVAHVSADPTELECLALNIYWEARSEPGREQAAVAHVTLNRVANPDFPDTICAVVKHGSAAGCQFSWWCDGASDRPIEPDSWARAKEVAHGALTGAIPDPTRGALYFHHEAAEPGWASAMEQTAVVGPHVFYR